MESKCLVDYSSLELFMEVVSRLFLLPTLCATNICERSYEPAGAKDGAPTSTLFRENSVLSRENSLMLHL